MLLLAIDTSGPAGGIALAEADEKSFRVIESSAIAGGTFSAQLIPTLAALLKKHDYRAADFGGFAAASGPGSFTGLRVGLSAIKGLAEVLRKPIVTVSVLEALAAKSTVSGRVGAIIDAGRQEAFFGIYQVKNGAAGGDEEILLAQPNMLEKLKAEGVGQVILCEPAIAALVSAAGVKVELAPRPTSEDVARIGARKLLAGETVSPEALDANYLRRSDAEIFFKGAR
jgi:tRNA threonylcarbamoyladenosine biosynthesis protein TsaB